MSSLNLTVRVSALVDKDELHPLDKDIAGDWKIELPEEARDWSEGEQTTAALDDFHNGVAIKVLDDFSIEVYNENNEQMFEDEDED